MKKKLIVLSGAGTSAESGLNTFRDSDGLWEGHDVMQVASPQGWQDDQNLVLDFYNQRRAQLNSVKPNEAHELIAALEAQFNVTVITQNVDDLHERSGSTTVIHLHGELLKSQSSQDSSLVYPCQTNLYTGDLCELGSQLRPFIVWFGEEVPLLETAVEELTQADIVIIIGTSMQVYPAASLIDYAPSHCDIYYIDPKPTINASLVGLKRLHVFKCSATEGMAQLFNQLTKDKR